MKLTNIILAGILSSAALTAAATETQSQNKDYYVQVNAGYVHGQAPKQSFSQGSMGNTGLYGIEAGYRFNQNFRASLSLSYIPDFKNNYSTSTTQTSDANQNYIETINYNTKVRSLVSMLNVYYDIAEINKFTPYLTLGIGMSSNRTKSSDTISNGLGFSDTLTYSNATHNCFAYQAGLGARYSINKDFDLDLHYVYANLGKFKTGTTLSYDGESEKVAAKTGKLRTQEIIVGIAYKF